MNSNNPLLPFPHPRETQQYPDSSGCWKMMTDWKRMGNLYKSLICNKQFRIYGGVPVLFKPNKAPQKLNQAFCWVECRTSSSSSSCDQIKLSNNSHRMTPFSLLCQTPFSSSYRHSRGFTLSLQPNPLLSTMTTAVATPKIKGVSLERHWHFYGHYCSYNLILSTYSHISVMYLFAMKSTHHRIST